MKAESIICGIASFLFPGLGQLLQLRIGAALGFFFLTILLWLITLGLLGWLGHVLAAFEAAKWKGDVAAK